MDAPTHQTLRRLTYFAAIADAGSIRRAASRLGLSVPVVSQALSDLEAELGVTLAHRSTRRFALTDAGRTAHAAAAQIVRQAQDLFSLGDRQAPLGGRLSLTLPVELTTHWLPDRLARFCALHPAVQVVIAATDAVLDLGDRMVDVAIRTSYVAPGLPAGLRETLPLVCVARSRPAVRQGEPARRRLDVPLLDRRSGTHLEGRDRRTGQTVRIEGSGTIVVDNREAAIALARTGMGATLVLERSVHADLQAGRLVEVAPEVDFGAIALDYIHRDALPARPARAFIAFMREQGAGAM